MSKLPDIDIDFNRDKALESDRVAASAMEQGLKSIIQEFTIQRFNRNRRAH